MNFAPIVSRMPSRQSALLAVVSAILLTLAFPDFEFWFIAWFAFVPVLYAVECEKRSWISSFLVGWIFGTGFFIGSCWWLTYSFIHYGGIPAPIAYFLLLIICLIVGVFPAIFTALLSVLLKRFGQLAILSAPFIWVFTEFLRYWLSGNNWNAAAYSQAFGGWGIGLASIGGIYLTSFPILLCSAIIAFQIQRFAKSGPKIRGLWVTAAALLLLLPLFPILSESIGAVVPSREASSMVVAIQPNVPMSGMTYGKWMQLRQRHVELAENALKTLREQAPNNTQPTTVIFPESPMNFLYEEDPEFQAFIRSFAERNNVDVLFNAAEPNHANGKYFNSAVLTDPEGREIAQYDKIYLVPFGESVPSPFENIIPALVGSFSYGSRYELMPFGDAKAGIMICYESHFGDLARQFVLRGADVLIEMTNDGYLGPTPVLRQHLASSVFRAVETNRPVLRTTNVGISGYINERGEILDATQGYTEDTRIWPVTKSDGKQTFYVRYGDWFAWLCSLVTMGLLISGWLRLGQRGN